MSKEFRLQDPGEGIHEAEIVDLYIQPGDKVKEGDILLDVETDKAVVEVPSPFTGTIDEVWIKKGDVSTVGDVLFTYSSETEEKERHKKEPGEPEEAESDKTKRKVDLDRDREQALHDRVGEKEKREGKPATGPGTPIPASPATRRLARELGVALDEVRPTGDHGRVTDEDVRTAAEGSESKRTAPDKHEAETAPAEGSFGQWGEVETVPLRGLRRKVAEHVAAAWAGVPHLSLIHISEPTRPY